MIGVETAAVRLAIALVFGAIIGIERQWRHKNAGIKTNTLVCIGAATFGMLSNTFPHNNNPAQIAAAVVTGIGFIGAGVIIHRGATVQGVTTAATLWVNASMGLAIGIGQFYVGATLFIGVVLVQFVMRRVELWIMNASRPGLLTRIEVAVQTDPIAIPAINEAWRQFCDAWQLTTVRRSTTRAQDQWTWRAAVTLPQSHHVDVATVEEELVAIEGVTRVEARFLGLEEA